MTLSTYDFIISTTLHFVAVSETETMAQFNACDGSGWLQIQKRINPEDDLTRGMTQEVF